MRSTLFLLILAVITKPLHLLADEPQNNLKTRTGIEVTTAKVTSRLVPAYEEVVGTTRAQTRALISAKVSGRIERILASSGHRVKMGDLLVEIEAADIKAKLEQAIAVANQADSDLKRVSRLFSQKATTQQDYDTASTRAIVAQSAVAEARTLLGYSRITAPFDGVVGNKLVDVGSLALPGSPLLELISTTNYRFDAEIPVSLLSKISLAQEIPVQVGSIDGIMIAVVSEILPTADPNSRTVLVKLDLPSAQGLVPGLFGRLFVLTGSRQAREVPAQAVVKRGQLEIVFVVSTSTAQLRLVKTRKLPTFLEAGESSPTLEVVSGLEEGEDIATSRVNELRDGSNINIIPSSP